MFPALCAEIANAKFSPTVVARTATEPIKGPIIRFSQFSLRRFCLRSSGDLR